MKFSQSLFTVALYAMGARTVLSVPLADGEGHDENNSLDVPGEPEFDLEVEPEFEARFELDDEEEFDLDPDNESDDEVDETLDVEARAKKRM